MRNHLSILLLAIFTAALFISGCTNNQTATGNNQQTTGGDCSYKDYKGTVTIKSIEPDTKSPENIGVNYTFEAEDANAPSQVKRIPGTIGLPKPIIDQRGIKEGKQFSTKASYIEKGTCAPGPNLDNFFNWH